MKEFAPQQIEGTKRYFEASPKRFPVEETHMGGLDISYFVIPQDMNPKLPDFALRMTSTDPSTNEVSEIFGVSNSVPAELRPY
jgi:hypothetical protein